MTIIAYTVTCTFDDPQVAGEWIRWLRAEHLADVCEAGASDATVVRLEGSPTRCEVRYYFPNRDAFETYLRGHAPRLRADGLQRFPLERGLAYTRTIGEVVGQHPPR